MVEDTKFKVKECILVVNLLNWKYFVKLKTRLAPLDSKNQCKHGRKQVTLPRLELLAVVIGVRVINFVTSEFKLLITKRMLFTDSECVLHWIKTTKQLPVFIQNWIDEIQKEEDLIFGYISSV